jgi:cytochrome d ubiquinol oxidase subunit II
MNADSLPALAPVAVAPLPGEPLMLWVVIAFLGLALFLYCLLGGADFGAGVLELFLNRERRGAQRRIIDKAMGPVWEANHMWLILMVVILFMGFPKVYSRVSVMLHIPLTAMLIGIIARGCSFTFRHYDAVKGRSQRAYTAFFVFSSIWTPFFLGVTMGALVPGVEPGAGYAAAYVDPWLRPFPLALGLFTVCLFAYVAAVYLIGECPASRPEGGELRRSFARKALWAGAATALSGTLVFVAAEADGVHLLREFLRFGWASLCMLLATLCFPALLVAGLRDQVWAQRVLVGAQVALILAGWLRVQYPVLARLPGGELTFFNSHAPTATLNQLGGALLVGSIFILPALLWLFLVFKSEEGEAKKVEG